MPRQLARRRAPVGNYDTPDEVDEVEERPARSSSRRDRGQGRSRDEETEEKEESRPARRTVRRSSRNDPDDDDDKPRRGRRSRDEDDAPKRAKPKASGGWATVETNRANRFSNPGRMQVKEKEVLLKFLEEEPFASYGQHWVGQRSYTCGMNADYQKCPLCSIGNPTRYLALFNVIDVDSGENRYWEVGPEATKTLMEFNEEARTSPLSKDGLYFAVKRFKKDNGFYGFKIDRVKEDELDDEFGVEPLEDDELDTALESLFTEDVVPVNTLAELRGAAKEEDKE
jgi:hypothetical protein